MTNQSDQNPFWDFSLLHYAKADVPEVCLVLQDEYQLSVNMLLFSMWLASEGKQLTMVPVDECLKLQECRQQVLLPLRSARYGVKQIGLDKEQAALYQELKRAELKVERLEHDLLYAMAGQMSEDDREAKDLAKLNIDAYLASIEGDLLRGTGEIDRLIQLVFDSD